MLLGVCSQGSAQRATRLAKAPVHAGDAAAISGEDAQAVLTLRPARGLELLAARVARVLALRFGQGSVSVGGAPPPGLLEAVPAGHLGLARDGGRVRLVLGAAFGAFFEASVPLAKQASEPDVRSLALAVEALCDRVLEAAERTSSAQQVAVRLPSTVAEVPASARARDVARARDRGELVVPRGDPALRRSVEPMLFVRVYSGASDASDGLRMGIATGGGLCVEGHCLVIGVESPLPYVLVADATDVRYRYPTITSTFYTRPWQFGEFAPAASVGFLSRVGYFDRDMGLAESDGGLDTDLGVRTTLEGSFALGNAFELTSEFGMDYALDGWQLGRGTRVAWRGDRATLWAQGGLRVRPF